MKAQLTHSQNIAGENNFDSGFCCVYSCSEKNQGSFRHVGSEHSLISLYPSPNMKAQLTHSQNIAGENVVYVF
jgi:hypothetical protein